jgi:hypothetical protein
MDINTGAQQDFRYPTERFDEKGYLQVWGGDILTSNPVATPQLRMLV